MKMVRSAVVVVALVLSMLAGIVASPWLMSPVVGRVEDWRELSEAGQAYGGISAILSGLALCGIAASLLLQWRQVRVTQEMTTRERHFELVKLGLEDAGLRFPGAREGETEDLRQWAYANLWVSLWAALWDVGSAGPVEVRRHFDLLFRDECALRWWGEWGPSWTVSHNKRRRAFVAIAHAAYADAVESRRNGPAGRSEDVGVTLDIGDREDEPGV